MTTKWVAGIWERTRRAGRTAEWRQWTREEERSVDTGPGLALTLRAKRRASASDGKMRESTIGERAFLVMPIPDLR